ncbi:MAG: DUF63 family protein [Methanomicrobiales archaeon]|nr:DUF63 family protein [Methanomicrobiales archaeon]
MIREFIYKYYIDPIRYGYSYTVVDTLTYAAILILSLFLVQRWMRKSRIPVNTPFLLATMPFVIFGGLLRVVQDTGIITSDVQYLLVTPLIFFVVFFFTILSLIIARFIAKRGLVSEYLRLYAGIGIAACVLTALVLAWYGLTVTRIDGAVLLIILGLATFSSLAVLGTLRYAARWEFVFSPLYIWLVFGQMLDASATSYGIDLHPLSYVEQHVVGSWLINHTGTAFAMFPLKLVVLIPALWVLEMYRKEGNEEFWHLVILAMIVVGLGPGVRDMVRMVLYV